MAWLAKEIPKSEHKMAKVQAAAHFGTRAAEHGKSPTLPSLAKIPLSISLSAR